MITACGDSQQSVTPEGTPRPILMFRDYDNDASKVAAIIAAALHESTFRQHLLEDLRDSPFSDHRLHLSSYLYGVRGSAMLQEGVRQLNLDSASLSELIDRLPEMEIQVPRSYDRTQWYGDDQIAVGGVVESFDRLYARNGARARIQLFTARGEVLSVGLDERLPQVLLMLKPAEISFGVDPESVRANAPRSSRETISSKVDEQRLAGFRRFPTAHIEEDTSTGGGYWPGGYVLTHSYWSCFDTANESDTDLDGITDSCEYEIANAFRPGLRFDEDEGFAHRDEYWAVRRSNSYINGLSVFYALGYHEDGGDPVWHTYAHDGDSEFLVIAVTDFGDAWPNGRWALETVTYSAHWQSTWDRTDEQRYFETVFWSDGTYRGRPRAYVAQDKHANYRSQSFCGSRGDSCDPAPSDVDFTVYPDRNLGNFYATTGIRHWTNPCSTTTTPLFVNNTECFWSDDTFRGWKTENGSGGTGYKYMLQWYDF